MSVPTIYLVYGSYHRACGRPLYFGRVVPVGGVADERVRMVKGPYRSEYLCPLYSTTAQLVRSLRPVRRRTARAGSSDTRTGVTPALKLFIGRNRHRQQETRDNIVDDDLITDNDDDEKMETGTITMIITTTTRMRIVRRREEILTIIPQ